MNLQYILMVGGARGDGDGRGGGVGNPPLMGEPPGALSRTAHAMHAWFAGRRAASACGNRRYHPGSSDLRTMAPGNNIYRLPWQEWTRAWWLQRRTTRLHERRESQRVRYSYEERNSAIAEPENRERNPATSAGSEIEDTAALDTFTQIADS